MHFIPLYLYSQTTDSHNLNVYYTTDSFRALCHCRAYYIIALLIKGIFCELLPFSAAIVTRVIKLHIVDFISAMPRHADRVYI